VWCFSLLSVCAAGNLRGVARRHAPDTDAQRYRHGLQVSQAGLHVPRVGKRFGDSSRRQPLAATGECPGPETPRRRHYRVRFEMSREFDRILDARTAAAAGHGKADACPEATLLVHDGTLSGVVDRALAVGPSFSDQSGYCDKAGSDMADEDRRISLAGKVLVDRIDAQLLEDVKKIVTTSAWRIGLEKAGPLP
jgi:hypothetical protein